MTQRKRLEECSHHAEGIPFLECSATWADQYTQNEVRRKESDQVSKQLHVDLSVISEPQDKDLWGLVSWGVPGSTLNHSREVFTNTQRGLLLYI